MDTIAMIREKARQRQKTIVFPEYDDPRVAQAAKILEREGIVKPLLLTPDKMDADEKEKYSREYYELRKIKGIDLDTARKTLEDPLYYAAMMTRSGKVDGLVAGAAHTTSDVARASLQCLGVDERLMIACSCFVMVVPDCPYGAEGTFVYADCGLVPDPNSRQLACIAVLAAELASKILHLTPKVALLSYSTKGSAKGRSIDRIVEALSLAKAMAPDIIIDGELQVDAAVVPQVAQIKCPDSPLGGNANVLIFPNLDAGNIGYKLIQRLAKARAVGPLILGLNKPCSDLSRGCSSEDVVDCAAITALRAQ
jgi:phosphate acetyltransferase